MYDTPGVPTSPSLRPGLEEARDQLGTTENILTNILERTRGPQAQSGSTAGGPPTIDTHLSVMENIRAQASRVRKLADDLSNYL